MDSKLLQSVYTPASIFINYLNKKNGPPYLYVKASAQASKETYIGGQARTGHLYSGNS